MGWGRGRNWVKTRSWATAAEWSRPPSYAECMKGLELREAEIDNREAIAEMGEYAVLS